MRAICQQLINPIPNPIPRIVGGLGLLSEYSVCQVGAPRVLEIDSVGRSKKKQKKRIIRVTLTEEIK
ncbi:hypothetical protein HanRHA438_Chr09g0389791 [Helianthus annuus]|nr:hypothetical protein HanIR_Chr09g0407641 [Helianthus annuus]KAJ0541682.1 hypothetical protein HanHA89_Chr09g0331271 [Helianthus annuus]KAJ0706756.1 hypothetical protein HanLR1_Chr09g0310701 [Helianthus annuus]KAJ0887349.1 hypothetical protein HanRHA438_Chr09g0389791 [Helianthus annuus]